MFRSISYINLSLLRKYCGKSVKAVRNFFGTANGKYFSTCNDDSGSLKQKNLNHLKSMLIEEKVKYMAARPSVLLDIKNNFERDFKGVSEVIDRLTTAIEYSTPLTVKCPAVSVLTSYKMLTEPQHHTEENLKMMMAVAWAAEILITSLAVIDDALDNSDTRHGKPCWHQLNNTGWRVVNDVVLYTTAANTLLQQYCHDKPYYTKLFEICQQFISTIYIGQLLDLQWDPVDGKPPLHLFSMDKYDKIGKMKTGSCGVMFIKLALCASGFTDPKLIEQCTSIMFNFGLLFQVQNDYLDWKADEHRNIKDSTDIPEGKCTWLVLKALELATPQQRKILEQCYGSSKEAEIQAVKELYEELDLKKEYLLYKKEKMNSILEEVKTVTDRLPEDLFLQWVTEELIFVATIE